MNQSAGQQPTGKAENGEKENFRRVVLIGSQEGEVGRIKGSPV
jgi:hypothetical protein